MTSPVNLHIDALLLTPAELPGSGRFWAVYERLDSGGIAHVRYRGLVPAVDGETTTDLYRRAAETYPLRQEE